MESQIKIFDSPDDLSFAAADEILRLAGKTISKKGSFTVALSGGVTPKRLYGVISSPPYTDRMTWSKVHFFMDDDRQEVPKGNKTDLLMVQETMLSKISLPEANLHAIQTKAADFVQAAAVYEAEIKKHFKLQEGAAPVFDLVLLGLGADGHTASLFPGIPVPPPPALAFSCWVESVREHRVSLTPFAINTATDIIFMVEGERKASMIRQILSPEGSSSPGVPAQLIQPLQGKLTWMLDKQAAKFLKNSA